MEITTVDGFIALRYSTLAIFACRAVVAWLYYLSWYH